MHSQNPYMLQELTRCWQDDHERHLARRHLLSLVRDAARANRSNPSLRCRVAAALRALAGSLDPVPAASTLGTP